MSEIKHTPGPWIWGKDYRGLFGAGPDNEVLEYAHYEGMWLGHTDNRDANARLIAAAPELLEVLQTLVEFADESDNAHYGTLSTTFVRDLAQAAIAKATGAA